MKCENTIDVVSWIYTSGCTAFMHISGTGNVFNIDADMHCMHAMDKVTVFQFGCVMITIYARVGTLVHS